MEELQNIAAVLAFDLFTEAKLPYVKMIYAHAVDVQIRCSLFCIGFCDSGASSRPSITSRACGWRSWGPSRCSFF